MKTLTGNRVLLQAILAVVIVGVFTVALDVVRVFVQVRTGKDDLVLNGMTTAMLALFTGVVTLTAGLAARRLRNGQNGGTEGQAP